MKAAIYTRVSTGEQTTQNQVRELTAVLEHRGWQLVELYEDAGISGAKSRKQRPALDRLLKDATKGRFDIVMCWAVDRLGRSLEDLLSTLKELHSVNVGLYLHQQALDTTTPSGRAMFQMIGVFAEFEREMIRERVRAGLARARAQGKVLGQKHKLRVDRRRRIHREWEEDGKTVTQLAKENNVGRPTIYRILDEFAA